MRSLWLTLVVCLSLPTLMCKADQIAINQIPQNLLKDNSLQTPKDPKTSEFRYGLASLFFNSGPAKKVEIDHRSGVSQGSIFALEKTAEASALPPDLTSLDLEKICNAISEANELVDIQSVLSPDYYRFLDEKVRAGRSQYVVLAMLQAMRPHDIKIMDFNVGEERGAVSVRGQSYYGPVNGLVYLIKQKGIWKIEKEEWYAGGKETRDYVSVALNPISNKNKYAPIRPAGLLAQLSPDSRVNPNRLALSRAPYHKNGRSVNFVFMLKKAKAESDRSPNIYDRGQNSQSNSLNRPPMHVLWTGSKRLMPEQKVVDVNSPVDFSIANFDDGYAPGQWNFIVPTKKPREVTISMLLNF